MSAEQVDEMEQMRRESDDPMPQSNEDKIVLEARANMFARNLDSDENDEQKMPYIRFRLGEVEEYGIPYGNAEEIMPLHAVTKVPCTPAHIYGVTNRRGQMLTVLDLSIFSRHAVTINTMTEPLFWWCSQRICWWDY